MTAAPKSTQLVLKPSLEGTLWAFLTELLLLIMKSLRTLIPPTGADLLKCRKIILHGCRRNIPLHYIISITSSMTRVGSPRAMPKFWPGKKNSLQDGFCTRSSSSPFVETTESGCLKWCCCLYLGVEKLHRLGNEFDAEIVAFTLDGRVWLGCDHQMCARAALGAPSRVAHELRYCACCLRSSKNWNERHHHWFFVERT